jgi:hypothetical protein
VTLGKGVHEGVGKSVLPEVGEKLLVNLESGEVGWGENVSKCRS